jgi:hypothetical protein
MSAQCLYEVMGRQQKSATAEFLKVLAVYTQTKRPAVFLASSGIVLLQAMRAHGLSLAL